MSGEDSTNMTREEAEIADLYFNQKKSYREIAEHKRVSFTKIKKALLKAKGEDSSEQRSNSEVNQQDKYSQMYSRFSQRKGPEEAATELNLPVDFVTKEYLNYWKAVRANGFARLYENVGGDEGVKTILYAYSSMKQFRYSNDLKSVGAYVKYCEEVHREGMNLEKLKESASKAREDAVAAENRLQDLNDQVIDKRKRLRGTEKDIEERNKELARINDTIAFLKNTNPNATAAEAARIMAEVVLDNHAELIRLAQQVIYGSARNNIYTRWLLLPQSRPPEFAAFSNAEIERRLNLQIYEVAVEFYNRLADHIVNKTFQSGNFK